MCLNFNQLAIHLISLHPNRPVSVTTDQTTAGFEDDVSHHPRCIVAALTFHASTSPAAAGP